MTTRISSLQALPVIATALALVSCGGGGDAASPTTTTSEPTGWSIPVGDIFDGGPGKDGIPALNAPSFQRTSANNDTRDSTLVVGVFHEGEYRAFPHDIMNWHEVANDELEFNPYVLSYCPLTGSAVAWDVDSSSANAEFGVSGLLYNSNLILYDRQSDSNWSQILEESVQGGRSGETPTRPHAREDPKAAVGRIQAGHQDPAASPCPRRRWPQAWCPRGRSGFGCRRRRRHSATPGAVRRPRRGETIRA